MRTIIVGGCIVNEGKTFEATIIVDDDCITDIIEGQHVSRNIGDKVVNAAGCFVLPGIIDEHVHFREPGLTSKADIESESRAAAVGGITSFLDMPNTVPQTTTPEALNDKITMAADRSHVNYGFFFGATKDNTRAFSQLDRTRFPGVKLFMGASTGNMLVDRKETLEKIFKTCADLQLPLMTHCEDTAMITANMAKAKQQYGDDPDIALHSLIRSAQSCYTSTSLAVALARRYGTHLHVAHVSTARELELFGKPTVENELPAITGEAVIAHLWFSERDYKTKGALIKCNPSIKREEDRAALREALAVGQISAIGTDHAPHAMADKQGGCAKAASGMPTIQFSLVTMLTLVDEGVLSLERLVQLMAHNPARLFSINKRGFLRRGYKADITIVKRCDPWTVSTGMIESKCGWSPLLGQTYQWKVVHTFCNGRHIFDDGILDRNYYGEALRFRFNENSKK
ncbi:dihydroorotase [Hallella colorans]|uniref:dihydroorotase n=1 Tax=Hallella colorans TaxID=1703337 RepID=UPI0023F00966|nr:dihydroorotase [Hallella colorans]